MSKNECKIIIGLQCLILALILVAFTLIFANYTPVYEVEVYKDHTVWPTTEKPTTEKPTTEKPTTEKPTTEKPTTEKPTTTQPCNDKIKVGQVWKSKYGGDYKCKILDVTKEYVVYSYGRNSAGAYTIKDFLSLKELAPSELEIIIDMETIYSQELK